MTLSQFTALVTAKWGDITSPKRLPSLDRDVATAISDQLYSLEVTDTHLTETYTTKSGSILSYSLVLKKSGNGTQMKISLRNLTAFSIGSQQIFTWKINEYEPKPIYSTTYRLNDSTGLGSRISIIIDASGMQLISAMPANGIFQSEYIFYINKD